MIRAETTLTPEHSAALYRYVRSTKESKNLRSTILLLTVVEVMLILWLLPRIFNGGIIAPFAGLVAIYLGSSVVKTWINQFKKPKLPKDTMTYRYAFDESDFSFVKTQKDFSGERHKRYESIFLAVEWEDWFFIWINSKEACVIRKNELDGGTPEELRKFLKNKLGTRFTSPQLYA